MTKVYLTQKGSFTASHGHDGTLAEGTHAHRFVYEVTFYGPLNKEGYLLDFREVKKALSSIVSPLKGKDLNKLFTNPTTETLCLWIYAEVTKKLPHLHSVKLAEAPDRWIVYKGE